MRNNTELLSFWTTITIKELNGKDKTKVVVVLNNLSQRHCIQASYKKVSTGKKYEKGDPGSHAT